MISREESSLICLWSFQNITALGKGEEVRVDLSLALKKQKHLCLERGRERKRERGREREMGRERESEGEIMRTTCF